MSVCKDVESLGLTIAIVQDAEIAVDEGIDGFIVSNHGTSHLIQVRCAQNAAFPACTSANQTNFPKSTGGRQIDGSISSLLALERIMQSPKVKAAQASGKLTVLFDSGIRSGADIFRAIALGAQGVLRESRYPILLTHQFGRGRWLAVG